MEGPEGGLPSSHVAGKWQVQDSHWQCTLSLQPACCSKRKQKDLLGVAPVIEPRWDEVEQIESRRDEKGWN